MYSSIISTCTIPLTSTSCLCILNIRVLHCSTAVALTKQLDTQGGDLTDTAGNIVATKSKGNSGHFYPEYLDPADLRRLQVGTLVPIGTVSTTRADARGIWNDHENGATVSVTYDLDGANHASPVQLGTQELDVPDDVNGTCDVYEGIQVDADVSYYYMIA